MNRLNRTRKTPVMTSMLALIFFILSGCSSSSSDRDLSPIADAGANQTVNEQITVTLSGSGTAMEGTIQSLSWSQTAGTAVTLSSTTVALPTFTSPVVIGQTVLTFQLTVTDTNGRMDSDTVDITVAGVNLAPSANAGADQTANGGVTVTLSGSGADTDGSAASYSWTQTSGPTVTLANADTTDATFIAPQLESLTDFIFTFTVTDNEAWKASTILVRPSSTFIPTMRIT